MRHKPPCVDCVDRNPGCHGKCTGYTEWKAEQDRIAEIRNKEVLATPVIPKKIIKYIWREMKRK